ncbi:ABC transporter ATP-binding protein [Ningiella sp. W23]|uniref:ABC transporter ATP-binding protein n=1 Tax=Ningiella sp. W23 TaxID=3023715 RepID=UPI003757A408
MSVQHTSLKAQNLKKSYGEVHAIQDICFAINRGGVVAVLGQNGAGKTSLIKCALGLEKVSSGQLVTMGHKPGSMAAKQQIGVILQDTDLPDTLTVEEQIELFASYYPTPLSVEETISICELREFAHKRYKQLSGGQKRRVQFALAIVGDPQLIFLDEPTTGLDIDARRNLWTVIRDFANRGKTVVLTTHYLEEADNLADRIIVLNQGNIVADTTPEKLHRQASGTVIRCQTKLTPPQLNNLPEVSEIGRHGRMCEIRSANANVTLLELLKLDPLLKNLSVSEPKLEDIFSQLTGKVSLETQSGEAA